MLTHAKAGGLNTLEVEFGNPAFLPGVTLARVAVPGLDLSQAADGPPGPATVEGLFNIREEDGGLKATSFDFASNELHKLNAEVGVRVAGHEKVYLRYFLRVVHGNAGAFRVVDARLFEIAQDNLHDRYGDKSDDENAEALAFDWHDLRFVGFDPKGGILFETIVLYKASIFKAIFSVLGNGMVNMLYDNQLVDNLEGLSEE